MRALILAMAVVAGGGCATVPRESVQLSEALRAQLDDVHEKHVAILNRYFDDVTARWRHTVLTDYKDQLVQRARTKLGRDLTIEQYDKVIARVLAKQDEVLGQVEHERTVALSSVIERYALMHREMSALHELLKSASDLRHAVQHAMETVGTQLTVVPGLDELDAKLKGFTDQFAPKDIADSAETGESNAQPKR